ncbi:4216_t:CDS:1, partial [Gigaspora margarita]
VESEINNSDYEEDDDSIEMRQVTHWEALNAIELLEQYLLQQDFGETARLEHDEALLKLQKSIRKFRNTSFKQLELEAFFRSAESYET